MSSDGGLSRNQEGHLPAIDHRKRPWLSSPYLTIPAAAAVTLLRRRVTNGTIGRGSDSSSSAGDGRHPRKYPPPVQVCHVDTTSTLLPWWSSVDALPKWKLRRCSLHGYTELEKRRTAGKYSSGFRASLFFGYEGRCGLPTNFDSSYSVHCMHWAMVLELSSLGRHDTGNKGSRLLASTSSTTHP